MPADRPGRRPGRPPSLTRTRIARAALDQGLAVFSMPSLARRLGVSHSTLYRYVTDRNDLVVAAVDLAVSQHRWPPDDLDWRPLLEDFTDALWSFHTHHSGIAEAIMRMVGVPPSILDLLRRYARRLQACGFTERDAALALDFVTDLVLSTALTMSGLDERLDTPTGPRTRRDAYREAFAELTDVAPALADDSTWTGRGWLDDKITIMLDGLATRRHPQPDTP